MGDFGIRHFFRRFETWNGLLCFLDDVYIIKTLAAKEYRNGYFTTLRQQFRFSVLGCPDAYLMLHSKANSSDTTGIRYEVSEKKGMISLLLGFFTCWIICIVCVYNTIV